MILESARAILASTFAPLLVDQFFDDHMGRAVFALAGEPDHDRRLLLGPDPARTILDAFATHGDQLASHAAAPTGPPPRPVKADSPAAFRASLERFFERGYTVRIPAVVSLSPALSRFTRALEFMLHQPVAASVFWSAAGARAPIHYDDNDNIVIQLSGHKQWLVSTATPTLHNAWRDVAESPTALGEHRSFDLAPGSLLYVPRGTPHTVISQSESLHLAVTFTPVTLRDVLIAALDHLSDRDRPLRETAVGRIDADLDLPAMSHRVGQALAQLQEAAQAPGFIASALQRRSSRAIGNLEKLRGTAGATLSASSAVRHNPLAMCHMLATPTMIDFCQPGEHINVHRGVEAALRFIGATPSFTVSDLPADLPENIRVALVQRLIASGFLQLDD